MLARGEVLIIDDDPDLQALLSAALEREGFAASCASTGEEGLALATASAFDAVVLDIMMPGMGGVASLRELKKVSPATEVIMLTAHESVDSAVESMRLGAFDYLRKPFSVPALAAALGRAVEKKRLAEIAGAAFTAESPEGLMDITAAAAARLFGADEALLGLERPGRGFKVSAFYCPGSELPMEAAGGVCRRSLALLQAAGADALPFPGAGEALGAGAGTSNALAMQLADGAGVLCVTRGAGRPAFGEEELRLARLLGPLVTLALRNSELNWDLRSARGELLRSRKMEALGMLVGQVTHDFNNLLSVIIGSVQLLRENPSPDNSLKLSGNILDMAKGASALVKQLLQFSSPGEAAAAPADLNGLLRETELIVGKLAGKSVKVEYALGEGLPKTRIRSEHFKQVALNLAVNARDAMPRGGRLFFRTRLAGAGEARAGGLPEGRYLVLEAEDEGEGIPPENLERIFEPFFTTKPAGKGTGLGLQIVMGVAREYGGAVTAANSPAGGAVFRLLLPAA